MRFPQYRTGFLASILRKCAKKNEISAVSKAIFCIFARQDKVEGVFVEALASGGLCKLLLEAIDVRHTGKESLEFL